MKPEHETAFIAWILSLRTRAKSQNDFTAWPKREVNYDGDPGPIVWLIKSHDGELMVKVTGPWNPGGLPRVEANLIPRLYVHQDYDGKKSLEELGREIVATLQQQVKWADACLTDCPFPVSAPWRAEGGHSAWVETPAAYPLIK